MATITDLFRRQPVRPAPTAPSAVAPGGRDLDEIGRAEQAFLTYTDYRRKRLESQVGRTATQALRVLPLLLHFNQPGVPGYVDDRDCPTGVGDQPSDADMQLARVFFSTPLHRTGIFRPFVELVAAMGSVGTIAFARDSDLDIWVCYDGQAVEPARIKLYRRKVEAVERWLAEATGRPVCLFLMSSASIRENRFGETSVEGCGSAMGLLLKEEFYRTHIHLAGRHPFWWLADPGLGEREYRRFAEFTRMEEAFRNSHYVDLGAAGSPRLEEYFGAAIWQIVKSWKAPLKSVLKMALLRRNVQQGVAAAPLCEELKRRVWTGERMDPYRLLFQEALDGCSAASDDKTAQLLGTCFYLKSATKLDPETLDQKGRLTENQAILRQFMENWGWDARVVTRLNNFARWKYEDVRALNRDINQYLLASYGQIQGVLADRVEGAHHHRSRSDGAGSQAASGVRFRPGQGRGNADPQSGSRRGVPQPAPGARRGRHGDLGAVQGSSEALGSGRPRHRPAALRRRPPQTAGLGHPQRHPGAPHPPDRALPFLPASSPPPTWRTCPAPSMRSSAAARNWRCPQRRCWHPPRSTACW